MFNTKEHSFISSYMFSSLAHTVSTIQTQGNIVQPTSTAPRRPRHPKNPTIQRQPLCNSHRKRKTHGVDGGECRARIQRGEGGLSRSKIGKTVSSIVPLLTVSKNHGFAAVPSIASPIITKYLYSSNKESYSFAQGPTPECNVTTMKSRLVLLSMRVG